ncbi:hypothetical protein OCV55_03840 [Clostridium ammoniilyticum]|uniref:Lipoprotein n=1 Tax=[Clostridium] ammoniilyticum TaxID=2981784 RepID=A0ABT2STD1_9FIRM|nr:hypothetical protein [[Clostridium] ammoniilyticum]MCU6737810.1 hypothetical protein [[Clostridium] ammoniilyticum]
MKKIILFANILIFLLFISACNNKKECVDKCSLYYISLINKN